MRSVVLLAVAYGAIATPAFAYLDGATGSLILQALIAGAATTLVFWRGQIARVRNFFSRGRKPQAPDAE